MARALYNKLNKYNLGGLVKRYEHGGQHAEDGSPIYGGDTFVEAEGDTGTSIYTTKRGPNKYAATKKEKEANEASRKALVADIKKIQKENEEKLKELRDSGQITKLEYNNLSGKSATGKPLKTMGILSKLGVINLEDYPNFNKRIDFFTAGWGDQTKADFIKGIDAEVINENSLSEAGSVGNKSQVSEASFIENMYKGGDPSKGFKSSLTNRQGELEYKTRDNLNPFAGKQLEASRFGNDNLVRFGAPDVYTYTEGTKEPVVEERPVIDPTPVVEEKVDMEEVTTKDPVVVKKTPTKDIVPVKEEVVVEEEGEVVEEEIPVLTGDQPGPPPPMKFDIQGRSDRTGTGGPGGSSDVPTQADTGLYGITAPRQTFRLLKEGETREGGGKLYKRGGLAMLAERARKADMGMKYNSAKYGRRYGQGGRMSNQELAKLLSKYNVR